MLHAIDKSKRTGSDRYLIYSPYNLSAENYYFLKILYQNLLHNLLMQETGKKRGPVNYIYIPDQHQQSSQYSHVLMPSVNLTNNKSI